MRDRNEEGHTFGDHSDLAWHLGECGSNRCTNCDFVEIRCGLRQRIQFYPGSESNREVFPAGEGGFWSRKRTIRSLFSEEVFAYIGNSLIASEFGWRVALGIDGVAGMVTGLAFFGVMPRESVREDFKIHVPKIKKRSPRRLASNRWTLTARSGVCQRASGKFHGFLPFDRSAGKSIGLGNHRQPPSNFGSGSLGHFRQDFRSDEKNEGTDFDFGNPYGPSGSR